MSAEIIGYHEYDETGDGDWDGVDDEPEAETFGVGDACVDEGPDYDENIGWCNKEERDDVGIAECFRQSWEEV